MLIPESISKRLSPRTIKAIDAAIPFILTFAIIALQLVKIVTK